MTTLNLEQYVLPEDVLKLLTGMMHAGQMEKVRGYLLCLGKYATSDALRTACIIEYLALEFTETALNVHLLPALLPEGDQLTGEDIKILREEAAKRAQARLSASFEHGDLAAKATDIDTELEDLLNSFKEPTNGKPH